MSGLCRVTSLTSPAFDAKRPGHQGRDGFVDIRIPVEDGIDRMADRHLNPMAAGQFTQRRRGVDTLGDRMPLAHDLGQRPAFPQRRPERGVAGLEAGAGQRQVAKAREAPQRLGPGARSASG